MGLISFPTDFQVSYPKLHFMLMITKISKNISLIALADHHSVGN